MPTTEPTFGWPLPELADPPDGPGQMSALASAIASTIGPTVVRLETRQGLQTVPHNTTTDIVINNTLIHEGGVSRPGGGILVVPRRGIYLITASCVFTHNTGGSLRMLTIRINDSQAITDRQAPHDWQNTCATSWWAVLDSGAEVKMQVYHNAGTDLTVAAAGGTTHLAVAMLRPLY